MAIEVTYPHVEKIEGGAARLERMPPIRVAQIVAGRALNRCHEQALDAAGR